MPDVPSTHAICIELCAGSARLSCTLGAKGLQTYAVDHSRNRHSHQHGIITIDLANDSSVQQLVDLLMFMRRRPVELVLVHGNAGSQNG